MSKYRVKKCKYTKKEVLQVFIFGAWLCLHNDDEMLDKVAVDGFKAGQNFKHKK